MYNFSKECIKIFKPILFQKLKKYDKSTLIKDILAGIIVGIIAIPLSIALAIASGASPKEGLLTAVVAGFVAAVFGGSSVQVTGPTGAFVVIIYGIIAEFGYNGLVIATILAGIMLVLMGVFKLGNLIKFVPHPIVSGFTSGIAIVILSGQIKDFFGLSMESVPSEFFEKCIAYFNSFHTINWIALGLSVLSIVIMVIMPKISKKIPGSLIAIIVTTVLASVFKLNVDTIGSNYPDLSALSFNFSFPLLSIGEYIKLLRPAFVIALLGSIESLLSAVVADKMINEKHSSDTELIGQGCANIASGLFGGMPATGAIARTAANIKNGGKTPVSAITHAVMVLIISVLFLPYAKLIPMSTLSAILFMVCYNMFQFEEFALIKKIPKSDTIIMLTTFILTIVFDLIVAIEIGLIVAAVLLIKRLSEESKLVVNSDLGEDDTVVYSFNAPLFFGNTEIIKGAYKKSQKHIKKIIFDMSGVTSIDLTAMAALADLCKATKKANVKLIICELQHQPLKAIKKAKLAEEHSNVYLIKNLERAISS